MQYILVLLTCCASVTSQVYHDKAQTDGAITLKKKRAVLSLQATPQVLNHPIVAAALKKISMNALETVASALNQVHQEELAKKSLVEKKKTLGRASLLRSSAGSMPMLHESNGSGDAEDSSGSGEESGDSDTPEQSSHVTPIVLKLEKHKGVQTKKSKPQHHSHHHRHHRHHRHQKRSKKEKQTKKINRTKIDWSKFKNNTKAVDQMAHETNIPVKKLLAIFRSGASRSEIAKQTEELLNRTVESQAELARLFEKETEQSLTEEHEREAKGKGAKTDHATAKATNNATAFVMPKNIPEKCGSIVKSYTNGELTMKDYLKELKKCKRNEDLAKELEGKTPAQIEAMATQNTIQQHAYNYALQTMTKTFKPTAREQANAVLDQWRTRSFGEKHNASLQAGSVPDTVKSFMSIQLPASISNHAASAITKVSSPSKSIMGDAHLAPIMENSPIKSATEDSPGAFVQSAVVNLKANAQTDSVKVHTELVEKGNGMVEPAILTTNSQDSKKSTTGSAVHSSLSSNKAFVNKLNALSGLQMPETLSAAVVQTNTASLVPQTVFSPNSEIKQIPDQVFTRSNLPFPSQDSTVATFNAAQTQLTPAIVSANIQSNVLTDANVAKSTVPTQALLVRSQQNGMPVKSLLDAITATQQNDASVKSEVTASNILQSDILMNDKSKLLTGQELAAEQFIASLANPALQEIPVDTSLVAALKSLSTSDLSVTTKEKDNSLIASLQKRGTNEKRKRYVKRDLHDGNVLKKQKGHRVSLLTHGKRDMSDKIKIAKPIERSNMGLPLLNSQPGPKLMDKIRDMSRVIATP